MSIQLTTAASARLEVLIRRLFSITLSVSFIEAFANALGQRESLNWLGIAYLVLLAGLVLVIFVQTWLRRSVDFWIWLYGLFSLASMPVWPFLIHSGAATTEQFQPWIWWVIGMGIVAIGVAAPPRISLLYLFATSALWFWLDTSPWTGDPEIATSIQDTVYVFLFGGSLLGLFFLVREAVYKVDTANSTAIQAAIRQATTDAVERERERLDALVHDKVLNTLLLASKADSKEDQQAASALAKEAIQSLQESASEPLARGAITPLGLFRALKHSAEQQFPKAKVEILAGSSVEVPGEVADALTEATVQALDNAFKHSRATFVRLTMDAPNSDSILIQVQDNGQGFRLDRIPRDRIGVRTSILSRVNSAGARARIQTELGRGTTVTLEWKP